MIRTAVIPVAGLGTRFLPATKAIPKEMIPIIDKPTIQYIVEEAVESGIEHIVFITGRNKSAIANHFDYHPELETHLREKNKMDELKGVRDLVSRAHFSFVRQNEPRGLGHAVLCARHLIGKNENFAVLLGDDVIDAQVPALRQMMDVHEEKQAPVLALQKIPWEQVSKYGVVAGEHVSRSVLKLSGLVEKPKLEDAPSDLVIIGRYILSYEIFDFIEETNADGTGEIQLTNALRQYRDLYGLLFQGKRYDAGNKLDYLRATVEFALKREEFREPFSAYLKNLFPNK
ncbi:MAG: UTP--glucose-1-phosphate uridylyltransferase [Acidobacteria bacterium CG_4_9_14_3_um_filter_49_7]|nr:MAG: UTP--glucose-1-phosphate uridylyltransferase [Acidobacteria bacterium CG_4_9_14_3_um_filter_49_7]